MRFTKQCDSQRMELHNQRLLSMLTQPKTENPMGAGRKQPLRVSFDRGGQGGAVQW
jgi:hypothetical protein